MELSRFAWLFASILVFAGAVSANVEIGSGVVIHQPSNNASINVTNSFNTSTLAVYDNATQFGDSNFSTSGSTTDPIDIRLRYYNASAAVGEYPANFSANTTSENNLTFRFTGFDQSSLYEAHNENSLLKQAKSTATGIYEFFYDGFKNTYESFSVKNVEADLESPTTTDNYTIEGYTNQFGSSVIVEMSANDASGVKNLSYKVDSGTWTTVQRRTASVTISGDGNHSLEYYAYDTKGNKESVNTENVALDNTAPTISFNANTTASSSNYKQDWILNSVTASDATSGAQIVRESFQSTNSSFTTTSGSLYEENHTALSEDMTYKFYSWVSAWQLYHPRSDMNRIGYRIILPLAIRFLCDARRHSDSRQISRRIPPI